MGYKNICISCRKAFNQGTNTKDIHNSNCPECGLPMIALNHRFRPPKKTDLDKWRTVEYLLKNGFQYQKIYENFERKQDKVVRSGHVSYPESLRDAKEFVLKYKDQAIFE